VTEALLKDSTAAFEAALLDQALTPGACYLLRLYIVGQATSCTLAIAAIKNICETYLKDRYELEVIDLYRQPLMAERDQIIAAPTLVKVLPAPLRRFIGDLSDTERVLVGLDLSPHPQPAKGEI
jgi:circadian clock protein KaiB